MLTVRMRITNTVQVPFSPNGPGKRIKQIFIKKHVTFIGSQSEDVDPKDP